MEMRPHYPHHHHHQIDVEQGSAYRLHYYITEDDHHLRRFSNAEDGGAMYSSQYYYEDYSRRVSSADYYEDYVRRVSSASAVAMVKVESLPEEEEEEEEEDKTAAERNCRICQLGGSENSSSGILMELGCSCKDDLATAHKFCAETWFKIKGNKTCEICKSVAKNVVLVTEAAPRTSAVVSEHSNEESSNNNNASVDLPSSSSQTVMNLESDRSCWQGPRFLTFMLACMVVAFIVSWLFHFKSISKSS
ncbi:hypothetical protein LINGRAHAP2_LOCUS13321 [Linum grandiflorum]